VAEGSMLKAEGRVAFLRKLWMVQRMMIKRMPSSIRENAQSSTEPKNIGVKIKRRIRRNLIRMSIIVIRSLSH
jgi:hypothetical protein